MPAETPPPHFPQNPPSPRDGKTARKPRPTSCGRALPLALALIAAPAGAAYVVRSLLRSGRQQAFENAHLKRAGLI